ncbi:hypothetical protein [Streptomyces sp. NPDC053431]|uniref:hypothetical protein n=1 Tax=Streptomyces sp. NPDC053431 TaxID=3365703 RepID=UPI0037D7EFFF
MNETKGDAVVLTDVEGHYYVLPREVIEVSRIEKEAQGRVDELLASGASGGSAQFSYRGVITLPADSEWTHFTPNVAWPNGIANSGRKHPNQMVMMDKPVIRAAGAE